MITAMPRDQIPTSRVGRSARLGQLAARETAREFRTRAANLARGEEGRRQALEDRQLQAAEQIVNVLGQMKGAAMKVGQVLSFLDVGLVPESHREEFQHKLAALRDAAPSVRFADMREVMESEFDAPLDEVFAAFSEEPVAAASIGQVYRATLPDGRVVAVKVQYPGVAAAVRADLQNLGMILRIVKRIAPGLDVKAVGAEIRDRTVEELDYELEAANQRALARIYRGHPFIVIPDVIGRLCRERVIVTEFVDGRGFEDVTTLDEVARDRVAEIIFRFYFGCLYRHHQFSGDPHPGNFLLCDDGRVAFIDFGLFKRMTVEGVELELAVQRAVIDGDAEEVKRLFTSSGFLKRPDRFDADRLLRQVIDSTWWYTVDEVVELTPEMATAVMIEMSDPRSHYFSEMRHETLPADHIFGRRMEMLTLAVISQLRAKGNFHRIAREWLYGAAPETELGEAEAAFYARATA
jgi:predicted unusual protein kinase regulating ubiquinone biosynthesis (AarF/ABC1/UbiB family)